MRNWKNQLASTQDPVHKEHYYQLWYIHGEPGNICVVQRQEQKAIYELWKQVPENKGNRFKDKNWQCVSKYKSLTTAQTALIMLRNTPTKELTGE